jgi:hypothetical protein
MVAGVQELKRSRNGGEAGGEGEPLRSALKVGDGVFERKA